MTSADARDAARRIEAMGAGALWIAETGMSKDIFAHATLVLSWTERIPLATGIANIWARDAVAMQNGARALGDAFPGRFVLGLGISHAPVVRRRTGGTYDKPIGRMREYLDAMDAARYVGPEPAQMPPRVLAALGPQMLRLARERAAGAHPYFVPVEHTALARKTLGEGPVLAVEQAVVFETDPARARETARAHMSGYTRLDNYANNLRRLGWSDEEIATPSDRLVDAIVAWGPLERIVDRVLTHRRNGADHVCVQPLSADPQRPPLDRVEELLRACR
ncbi:MAG: TIGR03620 family F420-dependent LLM class oxidoreductase [Chloroflexota bacterium]|nr:TIGR03620 family F420-dependent LLM class oxidoreductase [Chloroflexota bacterium]MDE3192286.1 TIGR03620 family F420-dependent LLM class oxidoreductase [Chloroflexota bacterium]